MIFVNSQGYFFESEIFFIQIKFMKKKSVIKVIFHI